MQTLAGKEINGYYLKGGIVINGKEIKTIQDLISTLGITHESNKHETTPLSQWLDKYDK